MKTPKFLQRITEQLKINSTDIPKNARIVKLYDSPSNDSNSHPIGRRRKYPFDNLEVGDCFYVENKGYKNDNSFRNSITKSYEYFVQTLNNDYLKCSAELELDINHNILGAFIYRIDDDLESNMSFNRSRSSLSIVSDNSLSAMNVGDSIVVKSDLHDTGDILTAVKSKIKLFKTTHDFDHPMFKVVTNRDSDGNILGCTVIRIDPQEKDIINV